MNDDRTRTIPSLVVVAGAALFAALWYAWFLVIPIANALHGSGLSLSESVHWGTGEFRDAFLGRLPLIPNPFAAWRFSGPGAWLVLVITIAAAFVICRMRNIDHTSPLAKLPVPPLVLAPAYIGLLVVPIEMKHLFRVLAREGITSPRAIGAGMAETTSLLYLGLLGTAVCTLAIALTRADTLLVKPMEDPNKSFR